MSISVGFETIELEKDDAVAIIKLNRPEKLNSFSSQMVQELCTVLDELAVDDDIRAVILTGNGRAFSAGYDLTTPTDNAVRSVVHYKERGEREGHPFAMKVWNFPKPIIAAINGYCLAAACEIAMLCDISIAAEGSMIGEPEIRFSSASPTLIMPWIIPMKIAKELLYTGDLITAERAYEVGMVNHVVPADELMNASMKMARRISKIAPLATKVTKEGINKTYEIAGLVNALEYHNNLAHILDGTGTKELREFVEIARSRGLKDALAWRDAQFNEVE